MRRDASFRIVELDVLKMKVFELFSCHCYSFSVPKYVDSDSRKLRISLRNSAFMISRHGRLRPGTLQLRTL